jgi:hypothetical protein
MKYLLLEEGIRNRVDATEFILNAFSDEKILVDMQ